MSSFPSSERSSFQEELPAELIQKLTAAIQAGENDKAAELVAELTTRKLKLDIGMPSEDLDVRTNEEDFSVKVHIEDRESDGCIVNLMVKSCDSVRDLKRKMMLKHDFPMEVQRWIIGKRVRADKETLVHLEITGPGHTLYLYLVTARSVGLTQENYEQEKFSVDQHDQNNSQASYQRENNGSWGSSLSGQMNFMPRPPSGEAWEVDPSLRANMASGGSRVQEILLEGSQPSVPNNPFGAPPLSTEASSLPGSRSSDSLPQSTAPEPQDIPQESHGWQCQQCTFHNLPMRPGCEMCSSPRPADYTVPQDYTPTPGELGLMEEARRLEQLTLEAETEQALANYQTYLEVDDLDLVPNPDPFTCPICFDDFEEGEGIMLMECLHTFCRDCVSGAVQHSEEAELTCPYQDENYSCQANLQEREIRALVPEEQYVRYLQRGLNQAESQANNSYHCKTANCQGWCYYEDDLNFFPCQVCSVTNCLTCKAIHEGMNCQQYQDDIKARAMNDVAARQTKEMLEAMVANGDAMHCPQCGVTVQKKEGCDWIKCSICKTELCWVTKGRRWGPKGPGDNSAGCGCRVAGRICHPDCINCH